MSDLPWTRSRLVLLLAVILVGIAATTAPRAAPAVEPEEIEQSLDLEAPRRLVSLEEAMSILNVPSVSLALIEEDRVSFARAYGQGATPETLYQAASLSKFVAAVSAMRLVDQRKLALDEDINAKLTSWKVPSNGFDKGHAVTLRGLLSMTAGIGVPGFIGYAIGAPLPNLTQILYGAPPANSPPVTVIAQPGSAFAYSGGGYEIAEALMSDTAKAPFPQSLCRMTARGRRSGVTMPMARSFPGDGMSFRNTRRRDFGPPRPTSPICCCSLGGPGAAKAACFSCRKRPGKCSRPRTRAPTASARRSATRQARSSS
jgi:hypothetical protein